MQVKYTVYYKGNNKTPVVDIWKTNGDLLHSKYAQINNILPQNISSLGYCFFNPILKRWSLEHYQMDDGVPARTFSEFIQKRRIEKRDRLLVRKKIYQTPFLNDSQLKKETWEESKKVKLLALKGLFTFQYD